MLEIVERLCTHIGIIHQGRLVAQGALTELRAGIERPGAGAATLEEIFLDVVEPSATVMRDSLHWTSWLPQSVFAVLAGLAIGGYLVVLHYAEPLALSHRDLLSEELCRT